VSSAERADQLNAAVQLRVAFTAKSNKVPLAIIAAATAELLMMDFQIRHRAAALAAPAISPQHLLTQLLVFTRVKPDARLLRTNLLHDANFCATAFRNACWCSPGKNLKKRSMELSRTSGFPLSRFAPAKKSAQIISRQ